MTGKFVKNHKYDGLAVAHGEYDNAYAFGKRGTAVAHGANGTASASGENGTAIANGVKGVAIVHGETGTAQACGVYGQVNGVMPGCKLMIFDHETQKYVTEITGENGIEIMRWYALKDGKFIKIEEAEWR